MDSPKFLNIQGDHDKNTILFISKFRNQLLQYSTKPSHLTKSSCNLTLTKSSNFLTIPNSPKLVSSKPNTAHYFRKFLPLVANHDFSSKNSASFNKSINKNNNHQVSPSNRNPSESSRKAFSPLKKSFEVFDIGPHQIYIKEMLSKEFDEKIKTFMENNDQNAFNGCQLDRFLKLKQISEYLFKEIEVLLGPPPFIGKKAFLLDLFRLVNSDYSKIITNFISFFELTPAIIPSQRTENSSRNKKNLKKNLNKTDLISTFSSVFEFFQRIYPNKPNNVPLMQELLDDLHHELDQIKNSLRILDFDDRAFSFACSLEDYIKSMHSSLELQSSEIESLKRQIQYYDSFHDENYCLRVKSDTEEMLRKVLCTETMSNRKEVITERMNSLNILTERIAGLEAKNSTLTDEIAKKDQQMIDLEARIQETTSTLSKKPMKSNKQTQATGFYPQSTPMILLEDSNRVITKLLEKSNVGFKLGFDFGLALVNLILNDKMIQDYYEIKEKTKPQSLQSFVFQWFLSKLGGSKLSKMLITDFFSSIFLEKHQRFRIFIQLVGLDSFEISQRVHKPQTKSPTHLFKHQLTKIVTSEEKSVINPGVPAINIFLRSPQACKLIIKAVYLIKFSKINEKPIDKFSPLFPMFDNDLNSCNFEVILNVFKQILIDEEVPEETCEEYCSQLFDNFMNSNDILKKSGSLSPSFIDRFKNNLLEKTMINIDYFLTYLLEFFSLKFKSKVEVIVKNFEVVSANRASGNYSIDDFRIVLTRSYPKKSRIWIDRFFSQFCFKNIWTTNAFFNEMLLNVSSEILQIENQYIPFTERVMISPEITRKPSIDLVSSSNNMNSNNNDRPNRGTLSKKKKVNSPPENDNAIIRSGSVNSLRSKRDLDTTEMFKYENYDVVNDLIVLNEFYALISGMILKEEAKNESLFINHQVFKKEILKLPSVKLFKAVKIYTPLFAEFERKDLIDKIEKTWYLFRLIFDILAGYDNDNKDK